MIITSPGGTSSKNAERFRLNIPTPWARDMGISKDERDVTISYDKKQIIIKKAQNEIIKYFNINFEYERISDGLLAIRVKFKIHNNEK